MWMYRRPASASIFVRDRMGRYVVFRMDNGRPRFVGSKDTLPSIFGRVNFANDVRFTGKVRGVETLSLIFSRRNVANTKVSGYQQLPVARSSRRRPPNQGMNPTMTMLTGYIRSASAYADWYIAHNPRARIEVGARWEWCHLLAHSMGGREVPANIIAARRGNNSEQLAIESALSMYRAENAFEVHIAAMPYDDVHGLHLGNTIKYTIRNQGNIITEHYLDCLNAPNPSSIHFYEILRKVARRLNFRLELISKQNNNYPSNEERNIIREYLRDYQRQKFEFF